LRPEFCAQVFAASFGTLSALLTKAKEWKYICEPVDIHTLSLLTDARGVSARFFTVNQIRVINSKDCTGSGRVE
jgi:hypothetical protein